MRTIVVLMGLMLVVACNTSEADQEASLQEQFVGKWADAEGKKPQEYFEGGTFVLGGEGPEITGDYEWIGDNKVRFSYSGAAGELMGDKVRTVEIEGDTLTLTSPKGNTVTLHRVE